MKILQVSGYPSDGQASNVSKDTTTKELLEVEGKDKAVFKAQNINLFFGKVNSLEYCSVMHDAPTLYEMHEDVSAYVKETEKIMREVA